MLLHFDPLIMDNLAVAVGNQSQRAPGENGWSTIKGVQLFDAASVEGNRSGIHLIHIRYHFDNQGV